MKLALCHDSLKIERLVGLLPSKAGGTWRWVPAEEETDWSLYIFRFLRCFVYFISLDKFFVLYTGNSLHGRCGASAGVHALF